MPSAEYDESPLAKHQESFDKFKDICAANGGLDRSHGLQADDVQDGITDDTTLLYDVDAAVVQFNKAIASRNNTRLCTFYNTIDVETFEHTKSLYPQWCGRRDRRGLPVCLFDIAKLDAKTMAAYKKSCTEASGLNIPTEADGNIPTSQLRAFAYFDSLTRFVMPLCSAATDRASATPHPISKILIIADVSTLSLRQLWNLKDYIQEFSGLLSTNYPEILDRVFIVGSSSFFSTAFNLLKRWVDAGTIEKLVFLAHAEVLPTLTKYIDPESIPKTFGGEFDFQLGMEPKLDAHLTGLLDWHTKLERVFPRGPLKWVRVEGGSRKIMAVGKTQSGDRNDNVANLRVVGTS